MSSTSPAGAGSGASASAMPVSDAAWESLKGGYDLQVHVAPDVIERRIDDLDLSKEFLARGLRGFVLKSHYFPTAERAKSSRAPCRASRPMEPSRSIIPWAAQSRCGRARGTLGLQDCVDADGGRGQRNRRPAGRTECETPLLGENSA